MELSKHYEPAATETRWYEHWKSRRYFNSTPDGRPAYTVVIPPPNVTGVLHMGHTLNETVQDILVRNARMSGFNACWVPGSDHASIATEARVVAMLKTKGIDKNSLSREEFLKYAFEWKETYGNIIYGQIARLGCSVDWNRATFTMDDHYYRAVIKVFNNMFRKGMIYRGARMINWDPSAKTALSDEEVEFRDLEGTLYHIRYRMADNENEFITIATQRPETIMGDTGICVNPNDPRYTRLAGRQVIVPLVNRTVPVIFDDYIDIAFGTGALKVTPAHDINDYNLGLKHGLPVIDTLNEDGTIAAAAGVFVGLDRFEARRQAVNQLREEGLLVKEEKYSTRLGYSQRTQAVVEPRISTQWFVRMKDLASPALDAVISGNIKIHPGDKFLATYKYWMENVRDWCISRQLWWGQRIPAWYDEKGNMVIAENESDARTTYRQEFGATGDENSLKQDEDVLDTWFSSWLWPIEVFHGITSPGNTDIKYYYPGSVLVTGQDIIFFWVARMIMAGFENEGQKPFSDVYFTGMVRDKLGRKMSKSLGNSPDLLELIDKYGADAVRFGIMISSPAGNDLLFDEAGLEQGRNFNNKIWNALKLLQTWKGRVSETAAKNNSEEPFAVSWFRQRLNAARTELQKQIADFRLSEALKNIYSLIWNDYCSWYLEWVKPPFGEPMDAALYAQSIVFFDELMQLLHPFMPFITEEIYHLAAVRSDGDDLCIKQYSPRQDAYVEILAAGRRLQDVITLGREFRREQQLKNIEPLPKIVLPFELFGERSNMLHVLERQLNIASISFDVSQLDSDNSLQVFPFESFRVGFASGRKTDNSKLRVEMEKELLRCEGFLGGLDKKLSNEKFVSNARPEVIELEKKKKADFEEKIAAIRATLKTLS